MIRSMSAGVETEEDRSYVISDKLLELGYTVPRCEELVDGRKQDTTYTIVDPRGRVCEVVNISSDFLQSSVRKQIVAQGSLGDNFSKVRICSF